MHNIITAAIYIFFALLTISILVMELIRKLKRQEDYLFIVLCFLAICWYGSNIAGALTQNVQVAKFFVNFILIFVGFIPPVLLLFVIKFYKVPYHSSVFKNVLLFGIPVMNIGIAVTANFHTFMSRELEVITLSPVREMYIVRGTWFWVHTVYCYILSMMLVGVILFRHFRMPKFYRLPSTMMVLGISVTLFGNVLTLLQILPASFDPTLITMSISLIFFNIAIINNTNSEFVRFSLGQLYHYLDAYILILDINSRVVDFNRPASDWFSSMGINLSSSTLDSIIEDFVEKGSTIREEVDDKKGRDIYFHGGDFPIVLNLRTHEMIDGKGDLHGLLAVFNDVTQNRMLIEKLEAKAGLDSLTGLGNHRAYKAEKKRLDNPENFPLSVIVCDVNNLKYVNDTLGHKYGDKMLCVVAGVLEKECPDQCFVARTGGDEFIYLLPDTDFEAALLLMEKIKQKLYNRNDLPFELSVALGGATKILPEQDIEEIIVLADQRMYEDKNKSHTQNRK